MARKITNELIISALLQHGTIKEAAQAIGTTPRTIYGRMSDPEFKADYQEAQNEIVRGAVYAINGKLSAAVDTVCAIMENEEVSAAIRLQAAQTIITNAAKFSERLTTDEYNARAMRKDPLYQQYSY